MKIFTFHTIAGLLAIGLALGVNFAQAQSGAKSALVVTSISLTPTAASVTVGKTLQFKVTAGFNNGSMKIVTTSATWSSSASKIASIGSAGQPSPGLAKGVAPGNVNITASFSGVSAVTTLNVTGTGATLSSFFISQINPSIAPGAKLQLFGYAEFSDGSTNWVTSTTNWTSSNPSVAAIQNQGQTAPGLVSAAGGDWHDHCDGKLRRTHAVDDRQGRR
jgi:uncharacterized protein YjdB